MRARLRKKLDKRRREAVACIHAIMDAPAPDFGAIVGKLYRLESIPRLPSPEEFEAFVARGLAAVERISLEQYKALYANPSDTQA